VGWDEADVLKRWEREVWETEERAGLADPIPVSTPGGMAIGKSAGTKSVVRLSRDAGRYLCEFALMESLSRRWLEARKHDDGDGQRGVDSREGKVAFLHVPGGYTMGDITRGVRVAEAAIRSLVASWEEGRRRRDADSSNSMKVETGRWEGVVWRA
jgi:hypothetical protein